MYKEYSEVLIRFLPKESVYYVTNLIINNNCHFKISRKRKTKLGDYRFPHNGQGHRISVNGDLNKYKFLLTTIHEFAHLITFLKYNHNVLPHGQAWKNEFNQLFIPIFDLVEFPQDIEYAMTEYFISPKASSCTDTNLMRVLNRYDVCSNDIFVEHLMLGDSFKLKDKFFVLGRKLRKYYICQEVDTGKEYKVLGLAKIQLE